MDASRGDILCVIAQASIEGSRSKEPGAFVFMARRKVPPPSRSAVFRPEHSRTGNSKFPAGDGCSPSYSEGEHHVRSPCDERNAPSWRAVGRIRPCPDTRSSQASGGRTVETVSVCFPTERIGCRSLRFGRLTMLASLYRKRVAAMAIQLAKDDPQLVKEVIARLRKSGEIEPDDLVYLDQIADRWIRIARENRQKARR